MTVHGAVSSDQQLSRSYFIRASQVRKGSTAPTDATIGTTPTIGVLLFDATAETGSVFVTMPQNWDRTQDCGLTLYCALTSTRTNGESLDITLDYTVPVALTTGSGAGKTSTQKTASRTVTTAEGLAAGDVYPVSFTLESGDATNPFTSSDAVGFGLEIHLTNVTGVPAFHLLGIRLDYTASR